MDAAKISDAIDGIIEDAVDRVTDKVTLDDPFEKLLSFGELVDRLSIVNFKLYMLKDKVMDNEDKDFRSWAAEYDVVLVEERARLKRCIDTKLMTMIKRAADDSDSFNPEIKRYGK